MERPSTRADRLWLGGRPMVIQLVGELGQPDSAEYIEGRHLEQKAPSFTTGNAVSDAHTGILLSGGRNTDFGLTAVAVRRVAIARLKDVMVVLLDVVLELGAVLADGDAHFFVVPIYVLSHRKLLR